MTTVNERLSDTGLEDAKARRVEVPVGGLCQDATAGAGLIISPKAGVPVTPVAFKVPTDATYFIFSANGDARYGENATLDGSATGKGYKKYRSGQGDARFPCAGLANVYVGAETGTITVDFFFEKGC